MLEIYKDIQIVLEIIWISVKDNYDKRIEYLPLLT